MSLIAYPNALKYRKQATDPWSTATIFAKADLESLADKFDTTETYTEGEIVLYQGGMYKCKAGGAGPGAWDATEWDQTTVEAELAALQTEVDSVRNTLNQLALIGNTTVINQNGTYTKENVTGMTANHKVANWGLFSDANLTTPISPNNPPADITIAEESGGYVITIANYTSAFYMKPTFILPQN